MARTRMTPADRKEQLLCVALRIAERVGYNKINRLMIVREMDNEVSDGLVSRYFGQRHSLRQAVLQAGIQRGNVTIAAQCIAQGDPLAKQIPKALRSQALALTA